MANYLFYILCFVFFCCQKAKACTTFLIKQDGQLLFGRNYDWVSGSGMVNINLRGLAKTSFPMQEGKTISWVSNYGSITFNQYGKEFPTGGMNEQGLVVELMWLEETRYPAPDHRPAISVLQWIQYQLDNSASVNEVLATERLLRIAAVGVTPLHYLIADKQGNAATIEFLNGRMVVHQGKDLSFPVLTNNTYKESVSHLQSLSNSESKTSSLGRFAKACSMLQQNETKKSNHSPVNYSFEILNEVAQGDFTKWSIVYNISESKIYFKSHSHQLIKSVDFTYFDFTCNALPMNFNINTAAEGAISKNFVPFSGSSNLETVRKSFSESISRISIPASYIQRIIDYQVGIKCKQ